MGVAGSSLGDKAVGCEADHSSPSGAKVKNKWICTFTPLYAFMSCIGTVLPLPVLCQQINTVLFSRLMPSESQRLAIMQDICTDHLHCMLTGMESNKTGIFSLILSQEMGSKNQMEILKNSFFCVDATILLLHMETCIELHSVTSQRTASHNENVNLTYHFCCLYIQN